MQLESLIGKKVLACISMMGNTKLNEIVIHGVETGGLWIESEKYARLWVEKLDVPAIRTPLFFVPYSGIQFVLHSLEKLELSEEKFGV